VRQVAAGFSDWHSPPAQLPLQQEAAVVQAWPSATHAWELQRPPEQLSEQHSVEAVHAPPVAVQALIALAQVRVVGSQTAEQQSAPLAQVSPISRQ